MDKQRVGTKGEWLSERKALLEDEKEFLRLRDSISAKRRQLPWVPVDQDYIFNTKDGNTSLTDLFASHSQLIIYHFMYGANWEEGCPSCSLWMDGVNGAITHFAARDAAFAVVSNAEISLLDSYRQRMGWQFNWVSSSDNTFSFDYNVSFSEKQKENGTVEYNFRPSDTSMTELPGISVFAKGDDGVVYHTYSTYSRGLDNMNVIYQYLDLLPKGRDEEELEFTMAWVKRKDQY